MIMQLIMVSIYKDNSYPKYNFRNKFKKKDNFALLQDFLDILLFSTITGFAPTITGWCSDSKPKEKSTL